MEPDHSEQQERYIAQQFGAIEDRLSEGDVRMTALERQVADMRGELARNSEITQDIRDILSAGRLGLRVLGGLGSAVKWAGMLAGGVMAVWGAWQAVMHGGSWPPKP